MVIGIKVDQLKETFLSGGLACAFGAKNPFILIFVRVNLCDATRLDVFT
jgi:hypothetical protein